MVQSLHTLDYIVFCFYFLIVAGYGLWIYYKKRKTIESTTDYFLAEGSLTWFAIGASLIASNISAEQFIGMSGAGFKMGLAIASYEWMAAATLIIVAVYFMPVYLKNRIYTMPQFLEKRYNAKVALIMAIFWLFLYITINLTSILYLGALAVSSISGISFTLCMIGLAVFAIFITLGGMKVIGYTDIIQVFFLILGGLATTYLALDLVATQAGGAGVVAGFKSMLHQSPDHFNMIFHHDNPNFMDLPGLTVLAGGMWIANFSYWGCNQYITQRALGADLPTARKGILFAAFLKLLMPVIVVLPGIAAYVLYQNGSFANEMTLGGNLVVDKAYPVLLNLLPNGLKGLSFAALTAAVVASLAGKANSISTIFSLDIYKKYLHKNATEKQLLSIGKITIVVAMILAILIAPFLGIDKQGGFQLIQEYTGFISPGIFALFLLGMFWKKTNSFAAAYGAIGSLFFSVILKFIPAYVDLSSLASIGFSKANSEGVFEIPFLDRMGIVFVLCVIGMVIISLLFKNKKQENSEDNMVGVERTMFTLRNDFKLGAIVVLISLVSLYYFFW
jgi:SSS family solute:Na+ symporter